MCLFVRCAEFCLPEVAAKPSVTGRAAAALAEDAVPALGIALRRGLRLDSAVAAGRVGRGTGEDDDEKAHDDLLNG